MKQTTFNAVPFGAKFRDTYYSGDWCIKTGDETARSLDWHYPMCYSIAPSHLVEVQAQPAIEQRPFYNRHSTSQGGVL